MKSIDLKHFALYSQKLPAHYLEGSSQKKVPVSSLKILSAYFLDFMMCVAVSSTMAQIYNLVVKSMLLTKGLKGAFAPDETVQLAMSLLPLSVFAYFFTCYFMNEGQTWGLNLFKARIEIKSKSFSDATKWALHSLAVCFSSGIYFLFYKDEWSKCQSHDYLYHRLMDHRDVETIDLIQRLSDFKEEVVVLQQAA